MPTTLMHALRSLRKAPTFSLTVVGILAAGMGVTAAIFALVDGVLLRPLPYPEADRLVAVQHAVSQGELPMTGMSSGTFLHYRANNRVFEDLAYYRESVYTILDPGDPERIRTAWVPPSFFSVLRIRPYLGRFPLDTDFQFNTRTGVLLSHDLWVRRYGANPRIIGQSIKIQSNPASNVVVGVAPPGFHFPSADTQIWIGESLEGRPASSRANVRAMFLDSVARLRTGLSPRDAASDLQRLIGLWPDVFPDVTAPQLQQLGLHAVVKPLKERIVGDFRVPLFLLLLTAAFLLLITWANATNLALVRAEGMRRDVAVMRALGASDGHLLQRFAGECACLAIVAGILGLAIATAAIGLRFGFDPDQIPRLREVHLSLRVVALLMVLTTIGGLLLAGVGFGSTRTAGLEGLTGALTRVAGGRREQTGRRILVVAQITLALPLLIGSALMVQTFWRLRHVPLGFETEHAMRFTLAVPPTNAPSGDYYRDTARIHDEVLRKLRELPGVREAEATSVFPLTARDNYAEMRMAVAGRTEDSAGTFTLWSFATPGYFEAMGMKVRRGRTFQPGDLSRQTPGVILSDTLAATLFGQENPIGRQVQLVGAKNLPAYTVVGVVGDVPADTIASGPSKVFYYANIYPPPEPVVTGVITDHIPSTQVYVVRSSMSLATLAPAIRRVVREVDTRLAVVRIGTVEQLVDDSTARSRLTMLLLVVGAVTALALGVVGLYGVLAYSVSQQTRELGVRIALGASPGSIIWSVVRDGARLAIAGIAVGLLAAIALTRFLSTLLYQVSAADPIAFASMAALLFLTVLAASYVPARHAGRVDPIQALKVS